MKSAAAAMKADDFSSIPGHNPMQSSETRNPGCDDRPAHYPGSDESGSYQPDRTADHQPMIEFGNVSKYYSYPFGDVIALKEIYFSIRAGEYVSILGPKGSGKTTIITLIGCMDTPTIGMVKVMNIPITELDDRGRNNLRLDHIGILSAEFRLNTQMTITQTVLTQIHLGSKTSILKERAESVMDRVGIPHQYRDILASDLPVEMKLRGRIARALANEPEILLCDEPTKKLGHEESDRIHELLDTLNKEGVLIIYATENPEYARRAHRCLILDEGSILVDRQEYRERDSGTESFIGKKISPLIRCSADQKMQTQ